MYNEKTIQNQEYILEIIYTYRLVNYMDDQCILRIKKDSF